MVKSHWIAWCVIGIAVCTSSTLLFLMLWDGGARVFTDAIRYLNGGINLAYGNGLTMHTYDVTADRIFYEKMTHHAPLLSVVYALFIVLGVPFLHVPTVVALLSWIILLSGMGVFTYHFCKTPLAAALVIVAASVSHSLLTVYNMAMSEVLFLPLLVWLMITLFDLHQQEHGVLYRLSIAAALLALLLLTRYVAVSILFGVLVWWVWCRVAQNQQRRLLWELPLLGTSALPLFIHLLLNRVQSTDTVGWHFRESTHTLLDGIESVVLYMSQVLLPVLPPFRELIMNNIWGIRFDPGLVTKLVMLAHVPVLILLAYLLWHFRPHRPRLLTPPRSPVLLCLAAYLAIYTVVQPFMSFTPIDARDMTTVLCLALPWLFGALVYTFGRRALVLLAGGAMLNVMLLVVPLGIHSRTLFVSDPPGIADFANQPSTRTYYIQQGVPSWLIGRPAHIRTLERYHPHLFELIRSIDEVALLIPHGVPAIYTTVLDMSKPAPIYFNYSFAFSQWIETGTCMPEAVSLVVAVLDWDFVQRGFDENIIAAEQKCPDAPQMALTHGVAYRLDQTIPAYEQGLAYAQQGEWQRAIDIYDTALAFNPDNVRAYADRGAAYMGLQQWEQAIADFDQAIDRMPGWSQPYRLRGEAYTATGDTEQAQADFDKATELEQDLQDSMIGQRNDSLD